MFRLIANELRLIAGHTLQTVATRLLATRAGLVRLKGDELTRVGRDFGCDRETDNDFRERVAGVARKQVGDKAVYREPSQ